MCLTCKAHVFTLISTAIVVLNNFYYAKTMLVIECLFWNSGEKDNEIPFFCSGSKFLSMLLLDVSFHSCGFLALLFVDHWGKYISTANTIYLLWSLPVLLLCFVFSICQTMLLATWCICKNILNPYEFSCEIFSAWEKSIYNFCRTSNNCFFYEMPVKFLIVFKHLMWVIHQNHLVQFLSLPCSH